VRSSFKLGLVLLGLVGINVYVFFFNRGTAPREVLNLQSTSKTLETTRKELLANDAKAARALVTSPAPVAKATVVSPPPREPESSVASATKKPEAGETTSKPIASGERGLGRREPIAGGAGPSQGAEKIVLAAATPPGAPVIRIPFAPPPEPTPPRAVVPHQPYQIPFAPPPEEDEAETPSDTPKKFAGADTLGQVLSREGFGSAAPQVIAALAKLVDPRTIRGGQKYVVRTGEDDAPDAFEYQPSPVLRYLVERSGDEGAYKWTARKLAADVEIKVAQAGGVVESSLYESIQKAGESTVLVGQLVELLAWDVNFYTDTHPGDHWKVIVEKQYLSGQFYKYGRVLAAEYAGKVGTFRVFFWAGKGAPRDRPGKYYDEQGQAVSKTMLKTPLRFVRISSKFDRKRFHPILHVEKAHLGIDYAAPVGTPVWASASGRVVEAGMKRGSGNTIVIAHANGLNTRYYHLSRFARGLHAGQQVKQKDVIGFVGTTGLSTGPHLHFSVTKNGAFVDPSKLAVNRDAPVPDRAAYLETIRPRIAAMKAIQAGSAVARN
jgi:murein DD-endopeptidase MepM/ murein hydrolase activator NlpD